MIPSSQRVAGGRLIAETIESIRAVQLRDGMIPWFAGGHADPWNHVEAAMALTVGGALHDAARGDEWSRATQRSDGSWHTYYLAERPGRGAPSRYQCLCLFGDRSVALLSRHQGFRFPGGSVALGGARHRLRHRLAAAWWRVGVVRRPGRDTGELWAAHRLLLGVLQPAVRYRVRGPAPARAPGLGARSGPSAPCHRPQRTRLRLQGRVCDGLVLPGAGRRAGREKGVGAHRGALVRVRDRATGRAVRLGPPVGDRGGDRRVCDRTGCGRAP